MPPPPLATPLGASVVLVADVHNPSIINHDFLRNNGIVGDDWQPMPDSVTTVVVSQIKYDGVVLEITPNNFSIAQTGAHPTNPNLYGVAKKYTEVLEHIPYVAIGLNWRGILNLSKGGNAWVKSKLLKGGAWQSNVQSIKLDIRMPSKDASIFSLSVNSPLEPKKKELMISCNFHFDIQNEQNKPKKIARILSQHKSYKNIFEGYLENHFSN